MVWILLSAFLTTTQNSGSDHFSRCEKHHKNGLTSSGCLGFNVFQRIGLQKLHVCPWSPSKSTPLLIIYIPRSAPAINTNKSISNWMYITLDFLCYIHTECCNGGLTLLEKGWHCQRMVDIVGGRLTLSEEGNVLKLSLTVTWLMAHIHTHTYTHCISHTGKMDIDWYI